MKRWNKGTQQSWKKLSQAGLLVLLSIIFQACGSVRHKIDTEIWLTDISPKCEIYRTYREGGEWVEDYLELSDKPCKSKGFKDFILIHKNDMKSMIDDNTKFNKLILDKIKQEEA